LPDAVFKTAMVIAGVLAFIFRDRIKRWWRE
jgi:hypothetical protein